MSTRCRQEETPLNGEPVLVIQPVKGLVSLNLRELWEYRELIYFFFWRDVKGRYRQMALGPLWIVLAPIVNMVLFTVLFGKLAKLPSDGIPYPLFSYSALLPWTFFSSSLFTAANSLFGYRDLISKVYFPRLVIPIVAVFSALVDFAVSFLILLGMMLFYGYVPGWSICLLPVFLLLAALTGLAVGLWWASWIVHYWDLGTVLSYVVRLWMFASPVVYAAGGIVPVKWQTLYHLNPMTNVVEGVRWCLLGSSLPPVSLLIVSFAVVVPALVGGAYYFRRTERNIVDIA